MIRLMSLLATTAISFCGQVAANPIPLPVPASMPLEQMTFAVDKDGQVAFSGDFTFDYIPADVRSMLFPLPPINAGSVAVDQDGVPRDWFMSSQTYPTVLPEFPSLSMFEWTGPFFEGGAVFSIAYGHDVFAREGNLVLFYSLGTGKYFDTYDKVTTAVIDVFLPTGAELVSVLLDADALPASAYSFSSGHLHLTLESEYGPFTRDLSVVYRTPVPATLALLIGGLALLGVLARVRSSRLG